MVYVSGTDVAMLLEQADDGCFVWQPDEREGMYMKWSIRLLAVVMALVVTVGYASATQYSFTNITNNNAVNAAAGEAQLFMDVTQQGSNVLFAFTNTGPLASSITDIYFDDNDLHLTFGSFVPSVGVGYTVGASPSNLPGGSPYSFSSEYSFDSDNPIQPKGVNPGESLTIVFSLADSYQFSDILDALNDGSMRVGLHVQGFANGGSEGFINDDPNPVPEPGTMVLLGVGMLGLAIFGKRRMNRE